MSDKKTNTEIYKYFLDNNGHRAGLFLACKIKINYASLEKEDTTKTLETKQQPNADDKIENACIIGWSKINSKKFKFDKKTKTLVPVKRDIFNKNKAFNIAFNRGMVGSKFNIPIYKENRFIKEYADFVRRAKRYFKDCKKFIISGEDDIKTYLSSYNYNEYNGD